MHGQGGKARLGESTTRRVKARPDAWKHNQVWTRVRESTTSWAKARPDAREHNWLLRLLKMCESTTGFWTRVVCRMFSLRWSFVMIFEQEWCRICNDVMPHLWWFLQRSDVASHSINSIQSKSIGSSAIWCPMMFFEAFWQKNCLGSYAGVMLYTSSRVA